MDLNTLLERLPPERRGGVLCFDSLDSTNSYVKRAAADGAEDGLVVLAASQTAGRGRRGKSFLSPEGGVYLSMLLRPDAAPELVTRLTAWAAVAVCGAVERACGARPQIKWVNDLLLGGKKLCGILSEMVLDGSGAAGYAVIGVGVNVNSPESVFTGELRGIATSIYAETGSVSCLEALAAEIITSLDVLRADFPHEADKYLDAYRRGCVTVGREIVYFSGGEEKRAFADGINESFELCVTHPDGSAGVLRGGEVSVRGLCGCF